MKAYYNYLYSITSKICEVEGMIAHYRISQVLGI